MWKANYAEMKLTAGPCTVLSEIRRQNSYQGPTVANRRVSNPQEWQQRKIAENLVLVSRMLHVSQPQTSVFVGRTDSPPRGLLRYLCGAECVRAIELPDQVATASEFKREYQKCERVSRRNLTNQIFQKKKTLGELT